MVHVGKHKFFGVLVLEKVRVGAMEDVARRINRGQPRVAREATGGKALWECCRASSKGGLPPDLLS